MKAVESNSDWALIDPKTGDTKEVVKARELWELMLTVRHRTGTPYLNFIDTANEHLHPAQKKLNLKVRGSNLCNEIHLVTDDQRTAVCCLASLNLEEIDDWSETLVQDLIEMLDNVLEIFINKAPDNIEKARYAAMMSRDLGLGAMGWHGLLMKRGLAFESEAAVRLTNSIFSYIKMEAQRATIKLANIRGSCPDAVDAGFKCRNLHLLAIAPNANSSIMANCTPSVEPINSNAYAHRTRIGTHLVKNKYLQRLFEQRVPVSLLDMMGMTADEWINKQWMLVIKDEGSVQKLHCLSDEEKEVFKTFKELDMMSVINQASVRQIHLCQGQSINIYFKADATKAEVNKVHFQAWAKGLKGLYYLRTGSLVKADKVSEAVVREALGDAEECTACHA
jgi:ribonucleoside-diphosphate reductase alpha chain